MLGRSASLTAEKAVGRGTEEMTAKRPIGLRLSKEIMTAIEKLAKDDDRSLTYVITKLLTEALRARKLLK